MKKSTPKKPPKRRNAGSGDWRAAFLAHLAKTANVRASCKAAGVDRKAAYARKATDEEFAAAWADAMGDAIDDLEKVAFARTKKTSDTLLIFLLKSHRRSVFGDKIEVAGVNRLVIEEEVVGADGNQAGPPAPEAA